MPKLKTFHRCILAATLGFAALSGVVHAVPLVTLVVPAAPGGSNDIVARIVEPLLSASLERPVVVENRGGAGGNLGAAYVARSASDSGIWLLSSASIVTMNPGLFKNPGFDTLRDFTAVGGIATVQHVLLVNKDFAPSTMAELLVALRKEPGRYFFGSAGNGTYSHILMESMKRMEKIDISHVPFRGVAPAMTELMAGRIQMLISTVPSALPYVKNKDVKAIAVFSQERSAFLPQLPTAHETVPGLVGDLWIALFAPKNTSDAEILRMRKALEATKLSPELGEKFHKLGAITFNPTLEELRQQTSGDLAQWARVIRESKIQID